MYWKERHEYIQYIFHVQKKDFLPLQLNNVTERVLKALLPLLYWNQTIWQCNWGDQMNSVFYMVMQSSDNWMALLISCHFSIRWLGQHTINTKDLQMDLLIGSTILWKDITRHLERCINTSSGNQLLVEL